MKNFHQTRSGFSRWKTKQFHSGQNNTEDDIEMQQLRYSIEETTDVSAYPSWVAERNIIGNRFPKRFGNLGAMSSALVEAAGSGYLELAQQLLKEGENIDAEGE